MKHHKMSVKWKLTLWIMTLSLLMSTLILGFFFAVSDRVVTEYNYRQLDATVRRNLSGISKEDGILNFAADFRFAENGVYTILYNDNGAYLAGQTPLSFPDNVPLQNGLSRKVASSEGDFCVLDLRLPLNWKEGIWVRGVIAEPNTAEILQDLFQLAIWLLPLSILVSALGAYLLSKKALQPINKLIQTAEKIEEGRDLSCCGELPQGTDEIGRLGHAFSNMLERLERSFEIEKQFTSDASHELRTPITVILTQCDEMLHTDGVGERYQEGVSVIQRQARRMNHMVNQLLQMTRLEQRTQQICMETANMSSLVEVLCEEQLLERGIMITTDIQSDIEAECDVTLMSRLLQNLLSNAIRYGRENGHVWVTLRENEGQVVLSVRDDGIGIPMDKLDQIWNRFYQGDSSRSKQGAGLGLAMVKQIAELHHGTVSADSIENAGSSFTVRFPAHQTADTKEK